MDTRTGADPHGYSHSMFLYFDNEPLITSLSTITVLSTKQLIENETNEVEKITD